MTKTLSFNSNVPANTAAPLTVRPGADQAEQVLAHFRSLDLGVIKYASAVALCPKPQAGVLQLPLLQRVCGRLPTVMVVDGNSKLHGELDLAVVRNKFVRAKSGEFKGDDDDGDVVYVVNGGRFPLTADQKADIATRTGMRVEERHVPAHIADGEWSDISSFVARRIEELGALRLPANAYGTGRVLYAAAGLGFLAAVDAVILDGIGERIPAVVDLVPGAERGVFVVGAILPDSIALRKEADEIIASWERKELPVSVSRDLLARVIAALGDNSPEAEELRALE